MKKLVYIVDSFAPSELETALEEIGLKSRENFHNAGDNGTYYITGAGGADILLNVEDWIKSNKLLVFTGSFHGSVDKAVKFAEKVKMANPSAKIVFRSATEESDNPVFDSSIKKEFGKFEVMTKIIRDYFEI